MADDPFVREERLKKESSRYCPILKAKCIKDKCQWWVTDFMEEKGTYRIDCAVSIIAKGLTDEALLRGKLR